jgi:hypothetical protein
MPATALKSRALRMRSGIGREPGDDDMLGFTQRKTLSWSAGRL